MSARAGTAAVLAGIGAWLPPNPVANEDLVQRLETSDEWIRRRTGIRTRYHATDGMAASDLAVEACNRALKSAESFEVDALVLATSTPDRPLPATAPTVAARLGLGTIPAFDVSAVCSGFLYGLAVSAGLIASGVADRVLMVATEVYSSILDPHDRTTAVIFGDGSAAVMLRAGSADEPGAVGDVILGSDGEFSDLIQIPAGGSRQRGSGKRPAPDDEYFQMAGKEVFRHAVDRMAESSMEAVAAAGWSISDVDFLAGHQANARILSALSQTLDVPAERVLANIDAVGNTGAASIPLLLAQAAAEGQLKAGHQVLLTAFGGGLSWGATTLTWPDLPVQTPLPAQANHTPQLSGSTDRSR